MAGETYYSLLEISEAASAAEIKTAYLRIIREVHPDLLANAPAYWQRQAEERTKKVNEAYAILSNREKRSLYDLQLAAYRESPATPSGQTASQSRTRPAASSAHQQPQTSQRPQYRSGASASSAQTSHSAYQQQQTASASAESGRARSQPSNQPFASKVGLGPGISSTGRFLFTLIGCIFGVGSAALFWNSASIGESVFPFLLATAFSFGVACLHQRRISRVLVLVGIKRRQTWATAGIIASVLLVGKITSAETQNSAPGIQLPAPKSDASEANSAPPPTSEATPPNSLENGTELRRRVGTGGLGELTVQNGNSEDAVVVVVNAINKRTIRSFYVQSGRDFTEKRIPPGKYLVYFFTGSDWNPSLRSFNRDENYLLFGKELDYDETPVQDGDKPSTRYHTEEITLNPVAGGNVSSSPADRKAIAQLLDQPETGGDK